MYAESIDDDDDPLAGLLYVCDRVDIAEAVRRAAWDAGLAEGPFLSVWTRDEVVGQTRTAAGTCANAAPCRLGRSNEIDSVASGRFALQQAPRVA